MRAAVVMVVLSLVPSTVFAALVTRSSTSKLAPGVFDGLTKLLTITLMAPGPVAVTLKTSKSVLRSMMPVMFAAAMPPVPATRVIEVAVAMVLP